MDWKIIGSLVQTLIALVAVLAFMVMVLRFTKKVSLGTSKYIEIIEKVPIHNQTFIGVIRAGDEYLLVSVTSNEVKILKEVSKEAIVELQNERLSVINGHPLVDYLKKRKTSE